MLSMCRPESTDVKAPNQILTVEQKTWQGDVIATMHLSLAGKGARAHYNANNNL